MSSLSYKIAIEGQEQFGDNSFGESISERNQWQMTGRDRDHSRKREEIKRTLARN